MSRSNNTLFQNKLVAIVRLFVSFSINFTVIIVYWHLAMFTNSYVLSMAVDPPGMFPPPAAGDWGQGDVWVRHGASGFLGCAAVSLRGVSLNGGGWAPLQLRHLVWLLHLPIENLLYWSLLNTALLSKALCEFFLF